MRCYDYLYQIRESLKSRQPRGRSVNIRTLVKTRIRHVLELKLSRKEFVARRLKRFRSLVSHAGKNSPYYARIMEDSNIRPERARPEDFPVLTKRTVMDNFDNIVTDRGITKRKAEDFLSQSKDPLERLDGRHYVLHTSGSSGEVGIFIYSPEDMGRAMSWTPRLPGFRFERPRVAFFGATRGHFAGVTFASVFSDSLLKYLWRSEALDINSPIDRVVENLDSFRPHAVAGYATALAMLAEKKKAGLLKINPLVILSSGEPLGSTERCLIESAFEAELINAYISTEHAFMGISRRGSGGMYLLENDLIFEFHEDHTCVTNLFNYTMPLIRYRMEDILVPVEDGSKKYPLTKVREIVGRSEFIPRFVSSRGREDFISPHIINEIFVKGVKRFQMEVTGPSSFIFRVVLEEGAGLEALGELTEKLRSILLEKEMENVTFKIKTVPDIPVDSRTGKFRLIVPAFSRKN